MTKPNIIFFLIDDMGWKDLTCYGSDFYETPNIDRLAAGGMRFTDAYAACPVCSPTRASIMTGKYPARVGVTDWIDWGGFIHPAKGKVIDAPYIDHLPATEHSIARALKDGGYATWHIGKWHLGGSPYLPTDHGFDVNIGGCHPGSPGPVGYFSPWGVDALKGEDVPEGTYLTDYLTDKAIELIKQNDDTPFFLNMSYYAVHTPIQAKAELIQKYEAKAKRLGLADKDPFEEGEYFPMEHQKKKRVIRRKFQSDAVYAAMIETLDENIGRLLAALDELGKTDDTVVFFFSDNGGLATAEGSPTCNAPLSEGKGWMYEGGTRDPLFVKWPGTIKAGSECHVPVTSPDFYPTLLEMAGLPLIPEQHKDGVSLMPLLNGADQLAREAIFWHYPHYGNQGGTPGTSMRMGDWKLIHFHEDNRLELYNLKNDIGEKQNLASKESKRVTNMKAKLDAWCASCEAVFPKPNPDWDPYD